MAHLGASLINQMSTTSALGSPGRIDARGGARSHGRRTASDVTHRHVNLHLETTGLRKNDGMGSTGGFSTRIVPRAIPRSRPSSRKTPATATTSGSGADADGSVGTRSCRGSVSARGFHHLSGVPTFMQHTASSVQKGAVAEARDSRKKPRAHRGKAVKDPTHVPRYMHHTASSITRKDVLPRSFAKTPRTSTRQNKLTGAERARIRMDAEKSDVPTPPKPKRGLGHQGLHNARFDARVADMASKHPDRKEAQQRRESRPRPTSIRPKRPAWNRTTKELRQGQVIRSQAWDGPSSAGSAPASRGSKSQPRGQNEDRLLTESRPSARRQFGQPRSSVELDLSRADNDDYGGGKKGGYPGDGVYAAGSSNAYGEEPSPNKTMNLSQVLEASLSPSLPKTSNDAGPNNARRVSGKGTPAPGSQPSGLGEIASQGVAEAREDVVPVATSATAEHTVQEHAKGHTLPPQSLASVETPRAEVQTAASAAREPPGFLAGPGNAMPAGPVVAPTAAPAAALAPALERDSIPETKVVEPSGGPDVTGATAMAAAPSVLYLRLEKKSYGLGLKFQGVEIAEETQIFIEHIHANGAADRDGRLTPGDRILSINGVTMSGAAQQDIIDQLKSTAAVVTLEVLDNTNRRSDARDGGGDNIDLSREKNLSLRTKQLLAAATSPPPNTAPPTPADTPLDHKLSVRSHKLVETATAVPLRTPSTKRVLEDKLRREAENLPIPYLTDAAVQQKRNEDAIAAAAANQEKEQRRHDTEADVQLRQLEAARALAAAAEVAQQKEFDDAAAAATAQEERKKRAKEAFNSKFANVAAEVDKEAQGTPTTPGLENVDVFATATALETNVPANDGNHTSDEERDRKLSTLSNITEESLSRGASGHDANSAVAAEMLTTVVLKRSEQGQSFGFGAGLVRPLVKTPTFVQHVVSKVTQGGLADGKLKPKDIVMQVNGKDVSGLTHEGFVNICGLSGLELTLQILRKKRSSSTNEAQAPNPGSTPITSAAADESSDGGRDVMLTRNAENSFGFKLMGPDSEHKDMKFYVNSVNGPGVVQCEVGDKVLEINGKSTKDFTLGTATDAIKQSGPTLRLRLVADRDGFDRQSAHFQRQRQRQRQAEKRQQEAKAVLPGKELTFDIPSNPTQGESRFGFDLIGPTRLINREPDDWCFVSKVHPGGMAASKNLTDGFVILAVNGKSSQGKLQGDVTVDITSTPPGKPVVLRVKYEPLAWASNQDHRRQMQIKALAGNHGPPGAMTKAQRKTSKKLAKVSKKLAKRQIKEQKKAETKAKKAQKALMRSTKRQKP